MRLRRLLPVRIGMISLAVCSVAVSGCLSGPFKTKLPETLQESPRVSPDDMDPANNQRSLEHYLEPQTNLRTPGHPTVASLPSSGGPNVMASSQEQSPDSDTVVYRAQSPDGFGTQETGRADRIPVQGNPQSHVQQTARQYPELNVAPPGTIYNPADQDPVTGGSINTGAPNEMNPLVQLDPMGGVVGFPTNYADLDVYVAETQTGKINFGGAYNSENGVVGQFVIDERNFDIRAFPRSFRDIWNGNAWRGAGQTFRLELVPGRQVQRYLVSFSEPYLFNTGISFSSSAYLFDRRYFDWSEQRLGGRLALGYRLTQDLSISTGIRMENVKLYDPRNVPPPGSAELNRSVGDNDLYMAHVGLIRDTRDHPYMATEGTFFSMTFNQGFGEYDFSRGDFDLRKYWLMYQRPDGSGRHTVSYGTRLGFSGTDTPIFENYFAGGFSTMRGFSFRGASPVQNDIVVGGEFQWLNTLEYMFPLTADDMVKGVLFCDYGTVEEKIEIQQDTFRVAPGFGFRVHMPAAGIGAPLAFDFAFPVAKAPTDQEQMFSFYMGVLR
ncbi:MAG: BamA/TamA family outer membrane protein [Mariniblastus sp.]|nr:BamA/TamA family outer membrane protein [Mariniblastus sp.]